MNAPIPAPNPKNHRNPIVVFILTAILALLPPAVTTIISLIAIQGFTHVFSKTQPEIHEYSLIVGVIIGLNITILVACMCVLALFNAYLILATQCEKDLNTKFHRE